MEEIWKLIDGFDDYLISNLGSVKSLARKTKTKVGYAQVSDRVLSAPLNICGYPVVCLRKDGKSYQKQIHRLVALMFIPNPRKKKQVKHKDGNRANFCVDNLEWSSQLTCRKIAQKDLKGTVINIWNSLNDAVYGTGVYQEFISRAIRQKISGGGFLWSYSGQSKRREKKGATFEEPSETPGFFIENNDLGRFDS